MKIYFARHGLTNSNTEERMMGSRFDESLNEEGHRQAQDLARGIERDFAILISSPLKRAYETADYISKVSGLTVEVWPEFIERDGGLLSGMTWQNIKEYTEGILTIEKLRAENEIDFSPYGGESKEAVRNRLERAIQKVKAMYGKEKVLIVTHAGVLRVLHVMAKKSLPEHMKNASVFELDL